MNLLSSLILRKSAETRTLAGNSSQFHCLQPDYNERNFRAKALPHTEFHESGFMVLVLKTANKNNHSRR